MKLYSDYNLPIQVPYARFRFILPHNPEDLDLNLHRHQNLTSRPTTRSLFNDDAFSSSRTRQEDKLRPVF